MFSITSDSPPVSSSETKPKEDSDAAPAGGDAPLINGYSNGIEEEKSSDKAPELKNNPEPQKDHRPEHKDKEHKSSSSEHKHKHKDKDREKEKHRDKDKHRDDKYKHTSSSSSSKDKEKHGSSKNKEKEKHHEKEHKSSSSKEKERDHKSSSYDKEKHNSSSSSHKDKHSSSHKEKHGSSSSSQKEKDKHNLSSSSSKDKEKHRDKTKEVTSSKHNSEKHKDKEKHREKEPSKEHKKEKDQEKKFEEKPEKPKELEKIKLEPAEVVVKEEPVEEMDETPQFINNTMEMDFVKEEVESDDDIQLAKLKKRKSDADDDYSPKVTKKVKKEATKKRLKVEDEDFVSVKKKKKSNEKEKTEKPAVKNELMTSPRKGQKREDETKEVWKWWEEEKREDGVKWRFLQHKGPMFAPPYEPLPDDVPFYYDGKELKLTEETEEIATFYAKMLEHDYTTKSIFNKNFFKDWRKVMSEGEKKIITDLEKCNFTKIAVYFKEKSEERKAMSKEEKKVIKEQNEAIQKEYGYCIIDGHEEKIGNFKIEPPGLFRGRGEHPKMGMLKKRVQPEDVIINCSKDSVFPKPPDGHKWKKVQFDNTVTWLACWTENVQSQIKYVMLNPSSKLKGEKDWQKYETARHLKSSVNDIRMGYRNDFKSKEMRIRQRSVALYFIDKLALRAGNEKDEDQADTVGCCSLRVEHIQLHVEKDGKEYVVVFDFLGKDSVRYYNEVPVEKRVFKNLQLFMDNKQPGDDLFDRLNTAILNKHLNELMEGLTAKVFRTYNASNTLQEQLLLLTNPDDPVPAKILSYNRANRAVAVLCNHQRAVSKTHAKSMANLQTKIDQKKETVEEAEKQYRHAKKAYKEGRSQKEQINLEKRRKALEKLKEQLHKLELQATDKEENKEIALGTSKLNYLDPRISVAWCKKFGVPIEKIYNKTQREKFRWAIDMAGPDFLF